MNPHLFLWHCPFKGLCKHFKNWLLTPRGRKPWENWLLGVWYLPPSPGEIDSPGYHTPGRFLRKILLTLRNSNQNRKYFNPLVSGPGRFKWCKWCQWQKFFMYSMNSMNSRTTVGEQRILWLFGYNKIHV